MADHMTAEQLRAEVLRIADDVQQRYAKYGARDSVDRTLVELRLLTARLSGMAADWVHVDAVEPPHNTRNESFGTEYLVHPSQPGERTAFYGRRLGGKAQWYRHGALVTGVTHYRPLPAAPEPPHV